MFSSRLLKQILLPVILTAVYFPTRAQEFYLRANAANNFGIGGIPTHKVEGTVGGSSQQLTYSSVNVKLGSGLVLHANAGVFFKKHFGAEIGLGYLIGKEHKIESRIHYGPYGITEAIDQQIKAPMLLIQPSLLLRATPKTFTPYVRMGAVWAFGTIRDKIEDKLWNQKIATESFYTGSGFGLQGGIGLDLKANEEVSFFAETTFNNLVYTPDKWELTKATLNEVSFLYSDIPKNEREIVFVESVTKTYNDRGQLVVNPNEPGEETRVHFSFSSISLGLGIKIKL